ncbi:MAG: DUF4178 domain-containing protein [Anaerolineae bacterium]
MSIKNAGRTRSIVCDQCGSQIDLTSPDYAILGQVGKRPAPRVTQFRVGMQGPVNGQPHEIIGRVVYRDDEGDVWDEWLILSAAGEYVWLSESDNFGMAMWHSFVPPEPVEPQTAHEGSTIRIRGENIRVRDAGHATIDYLEGALTWKAHIGDGMNYVEADSAKQRISIEYTETEVEFFWGEVLNAAEIQKAFGVPAQPVRPLMAMPGAGGSKLGALVGGWIFLIICVIIACGGVVVFGANSSSAAEICVTPVASGTSSASATPGPSPTPYCYVPTSQPGSSSSGWFGGGGSTRSGSSGRSFSSSSSHSSSSSSSHGGK